MKTVHETMRGTHRDNQVVFGLQLITQREDKALCVLLALTNEEHPTNTNTHIQTHNTKVNVTSAGKHTDIICLTCHGNIL